MDSEIRICEKTGLPLIDRGFVVKDGEAYFLREEDLEDYVKLCGYGNKTEAYNEGFYYYTEWNEDEVMDKEEYIRYEVSSVLKDGVTEIPSTTTIQSLRLIAEAKWSMAEKG